MTSPRVSILVAVYNVEDHVEAALQSALSQTIEDIEVIVVDDGSEDASGRIADRIAASDPRLRVVHQDNAGLGAARNRGLAEAKGEWIAFLDGDDALLPDYLECLLNCAEATKADWAAGGVTFVMGDDTHYRGPLSGDGEITAPTSKTTALDLADWEMAVELLPSTWNKVYRRRLLEDIRFDEGVWFEDHAFLAALFEKADRIGLVDAPVIRHTRARDGQITGCDDDRVFDHFDIIESLAVIYKGSDKPGGTEAFQDISGRLLQERLPALKNRDRRAAFLAKARESVARHAARIPPMFADWLAKGPVLDVVLYADAASEALSNTLNDLEQQAFQGFSVTVVSDNDLGLPPSDVLDLQYAVQPGKGVSFGLNHGVAIGHAPLVTFLAPGVRLTEWAVWYWCEEMLADQVDVGVSAYHPSSEGAPRTALGHAGLEDESSRDATPYIPSVDPWDLPTTGLVFRRAHLVRNRLVFTRGRLKDWLMGYLGLLTADTSKILPKPGLFAVSIPPSEDVSDDLLHTLHRIAVHLPDAHGKGAFVANTYWRANYPQPGTSGSLRSRLDLMTAWKIRMRYGPAKDPALNVPRPARTVMTWGNTP